MTTQTDVLAWLDSLYETNADGALTGRKWPEAQAVHAAVAELMEAVDEVLFFHRNGEVFSAARLARALANMGPQA